MSNFYTYHYLTQQPSHINNIILLINVVLLTIVIISLLLFLSHRDDGKYRELTIITILALLLTLTIQYDNWQKNRNSVNGNSQVASLIKQVSLNQHVPVKHIYSNSTILSDGMLIKINSQIMKVNLNNDNSSFELVRVHLTNPKIHIINH